MSISTTYTVFCTGCGRRATEQSDESKREALQFAKAQGYRRVKVPNGSYWDFCPTCYTRHVNGKNITTPTA